MTRLASERIALQCAAMSERNHWAKMTAALLKVKDAKTKTLQNWPLEHLVIWLRDNCRCVYCGRDMLEDRDITYFLYSYDHVLPVTRFPNLEQALWNRVLACRGCNTWKGDFDPSQDGTPPTEEYRDRLMEMAKEYIHTSPRRREAETLFAKEKAVITEALRTCESAKGVGV